jgi:hypothetical protein
MDSTNTVSAAATSPAARNESHPEPIQRISPPIWTHLRILRRLWGRAQNRSFGRAPVIGLTPGVAGREG